MHLKAVKPGQGFFLHTLILCRAGHGDRRLSDSGRQGETHRDITQDLQKSLGKTQFSSLPGKRQQTPSRLQGEQQSSGRCALGCSGTSRLRSRQPQGCCASFCSNREQIEQTLMCLIRRFRRSVSRKQSPLISHILLKHC